MSRLEKFFLFGYFLLSGVTWVADGSGISGRIALAELWFLVFLPLVLVRILKRSNGKIWFPRTSLGLFALWFVLLISIVKSANQDQSFVEFAGHSILIVVFFVVYVVAQSSSDQDRISIAMLWMWAATILATVGLLDFFSHIGGWPQLPRPTNYESLEGGLVGTFRNTGQAGAFYVSALLMGLALSESTTTERRLLQVMCLVLGLALLLTTKRAAMISGLIGVVMITFMSGVRKKKLSPAIFISTAVLIVGAAYSYVRSHSAAFSARSERKISAAAEIFDSRSFWLNNLSDAWAAFSDNPILGAGVGGIVNVYSSHEIHSSYGSVLASLGVVGFVVYVAFCVQLVAGTASCKSSDSRARRLASLALAIWIPLFIGYSYTYHLRKREFWITAAILSAMAAPSCRDSRRERRESSDRLPAAVPLKLETD